MKKVECMLSAKEEELMDMLWEVKKPMTSLDMLNEKWDRTWKDTYLPVMLQSLQEKELIKVCSVKKHVKTYIRIFEPAMSREGYIAKLAVSKIKDGKIEKVIYALVEECKNAGIPIDSDFFERLETIIYGTEADVDPSQDV